MKNPVYSATVLYDDPIDCKIIVKLQIFPYACWQVNTYMPYAFMHALHYSLTLTTMGTHLCNSKMSLLMVINRN